MWVDADGYHAERPENPKDWQQSAQVRARAREGTGPGVQDRLAHCKYRIPNTSVVNKVGDVKSVPLLRLPPHGGVPKHESKLQSTHAHARLASHTRTHACTSPL